MSKQTEALKLALDALEDYAPKVCGAAITAIKEALAEQPAQQQSCYCPNCEALSKELAAIKAQQQEPVEYVRKMIDALYENGDPVSVEAAELLEQMTQQQEPVAYVYEREIDGFGLRKDVKFLRPVEVGTDLYTSPPPHKPLTDEEITQIAATPAAIPGSYVFSFARAIEAKLKEKNT